MTYNDLILPILLFLFGVFRRLGEVPHIWGNSTIYKLRYYWMAGSLWWRSAYPRQNRTWYNVIFADAYHFFSNLHWMITPVLYFGEVSLLSVIIAYPAYWLGSEGTLRLIVKK